LLLAHEGFAGELQKNTLVGGRHIRAILYQWSGNPNRGSRPSPRA
jgi:hypothetical protein